MSRHQPSTPPPLPQQQQQAPSAMYNTMPRLATGLRSPAPRQRNTMDSNDSGGGLYEYDLGSGGDDHGYLDDEDVPLGAGLMGQLPRRNHTISSATAKTRRLAQHFEQSSREAAGDVGASNSADAFHSPTVLSPNRNSLKEIAGAENEHDEWERAILDEHKSAADDLAALPSGSSGGSLAGSASAAAVRRHQSLNHHLGRSMASRLGGAGAGSGSSPGVAVTSRHSPSASRQHNTLSGALSPPFMGARLQDAFRDGGSAWNGGGNGGNHPTAATPSPPLPTTATADERRAGSPAAPARPGTDLMDIHAFLQQMNLGNGGGPEDEGGGGGGGGATTTAAAAAKKLPSLITSPEALARGARGHTRNNSSYSGPLGGGGGPSSASPSVLSRPALPAHLTSGGGHSRIQSTDAAFGIGSGGNGNGSGGAVQAGPHTAAPVSTWADKERLAGINSSGGLGMPFERQNPTASPPTGAGEDLMGRQQRHPPQSHPHAHQLNSAHPQLHHHNQPHHRSTPPRGGIPSQWGLGLSPAVDRGSASRDQITYALSVALAEQQHKTAVLEAALRASSAAGGGGGGAGGALGMDAGQFPAGGVDASAFGQAHQRAMSGPMLGGHPPPQQPQQMYPTMGGVVSQTPPPPPPAGRFHEIAARLSLNPTDYDASPPASSRFVVIKSFTEDDVHRSIRHGIWASTDKGNQRLDRIFKECQSQSRNESEDATHQNGSTTSSSPAVYLFFSVNGSGHFCGVAQMTSAVDFETSSDVWAQEGKWKGTFSVKHIFVKDVPNRELRHIPHPNKTENKSVTQSRDTQELPRETGVEMLRIISAYPARTSLLSALDAQRQQQGDLDVLQGNVEGGLQGNYPPARGAYPQPLQPPRPFHSHNSSGSSAGNGNGSGADPYYPFGPPPPPLAPTQTHGFGSPFPAHQTFGQTQTPPPLMRMAPGPPQSQVPTLGQQHSRAQFHGHGYLYQ